MSVVAPTFNRMSSVLVPKFESIATGDIGTYLSSPNWVLEQKMDGIRVLMQITPMPSGRPHRVACTIDHEPSKNAIVNNFDHTHRTNAAFSEVSQELLLDGELVDGCLWVFDVPWCNVWLGGTTFSQRREILELLAVRYGWNDKTSPVRVVPCARTESEKTALWDTILNNGGEGAMLKNICGLYPSTNKRIKDGLKCKRTYTAECLVINRDVSGSKNAVLGLYDPTMKQVRDVGRCSMIGKADAQPGDVIEVEFLYVPDLSCPKLYQPRMLRIRDDRRASDCTIDQIAHCEARKAVIA